MATKVSYNSSLAVPFVVCFGLFCFSSLLNKTILTDLKMVFARTNYIMLHCGWGNICFNVWLC